MLLEASFNKKQNHTDQKETGVTVSDEPFRAEVSVLVIFYCLLSLNNWMLLEASFNKKQNHTDQKETGVTVSDEPFRAEESVLVIFHFT